MNLHTSGMSKTMINLLVACLWCNLCLKNYVFLCIQGPWWRQTLHYISHLLILVSFGRVYEYFTQTKMRLRLYSSQKRLKMNPIWQLPNFILFGLPRGSCFWDVCVSTFACHCSSNGFTGFDKWGVVGLFSTSNELKIYQKQINNDKWDVVRFV